MLQDEFLFDNNDGLGGYESGGYDENAIHPVDVNWTRQSKYTIPNNPQLLWKVSVDNAFVNESIVHGSFVVDRDRNIIVSDCDNNILEPHFGRLMKIKTNGEIEELFRNNRQLKSPVIGKNGCIYITTTGAIKSKGHKLFSILPDGNVKWEFDIDEEAYSKPVLDSDGNVYIYTYSDMGTLFSISLEGSLNWQRKFNSVNWYEPIITKEGLILIGLNVHHTLCALNKKGETIWEKKLGQGLGEYPMYLKDDGTIYACLSSKLFALNKNGEVLWDYMPGEGYVASTPAVDNMANLYLNLTDFEIASLNIAGKERWRTVVKGAANVPPIVGSCNKIYQESFMQRYPQYVSWVEAFTKDGQKLWDFELNGTIVSSVLANNNLIYILSNCHTYSKKGWKDKMNVKWEIHAIGDV
ncbi:Pyrrolo-quinoline quinone repeat-containing protein [Ruminiclostridium papyrosolvens DSM 2782]|uniref:Pyrrolo-quinoline quinone repeat-containing protein n=1 Tax=Ruminiclostridium papyrosolvens DSM 2782 TaxID=588581 RepID=F1TI07_9FIRM|nr:PQQ-binding-like beta-propeller repeat protein [Ruminiclostridium papyrosolvens]EGD45942.1 Pyrrolo-quinoline quinone repeat-containing protein [Ruminiclostridium papyrosolvens DSM 2782]WES33668.1 PQQ-binding-like beta-propeller repeat protein [Ruminiclostridium papyrosolvens DSM 2782]